MLNFSKINILIIYLIFFSIAIFSSLNFQKKNNEYIDKKINLGLDLQGGSYLLLEINSDTLVQEKIQDKVIPIKKLLKDDRLIRAFSPKDKRRSINSLSQKGLTIYEQVVPLAKKYETIILNKLSDKESDQLDQLIEKLNEIQIHLHDH